MSEKDILRIMISTDNHLGVYEHDPVRGEDSFVAFEEVLRKAVEMDADMLLLGGDLFHDNKPSRNTIVKAMRILKKYCLNDRPVSFQVLSDQAKNFPTTGKVNYEDENLNVGLPVFTIHGNHDDPSGTGRLSAVDILSECGLVNYFGNMELQGSAMGRLKISPILLQKGETYVALYGFGNIRDERLARLFKTPGSVEWERPALDESDSESKWYNIFVVHQNRAKHSPKNHLDEGSLPPFLDFTLWGHEHQCIPATTLSAHADTEILQAGSTVATSLSEGEADPKHCFLLEINESRFRIQKHPLETVRPFNYQQLSLRTVPDLDPEDTQGVEVLLERKVKEMIQSALESAGVSADDKAILPLIRLKVDYTGFSTVNVQRFGQQYVTKVANPQDILLFSKQAQRKAQQTDKTDATDIGSLRPEQLDQTRIEDLVTENLGPGEPLEILVEEELRSALHAFVDKDEKQALDSCVKENLERLQNDVEKSLTQANAPEDFGDFGDLIRSHSSKPSATQGKDRAALLSAEKKPPEMSSVAKIPVETPDEPSTGQRAKSVAVSPVGMPAPQPRRPTKAATQPAEQRSISAFLSGSQRKAASSHASAAPLASTSVLSTGDNKCQTTQSSRKRQRPRAQKSGASARYSSDSDEVISLTGSDDDYEPAGSTLIPTPKRGTRSQAPQESARKRGRYSTNRSDSMASPQAPSEQKGAGMDDVIVVESDDEEERRPRGRSRTFGNSRQTPSTARPSWGAMRK